MEKVSDLGEMSFSNEPKTLKLLIVKGIIRKKKVVAWQEPKANERVGAAYKSFRIGGGFDELALAVAAKARNSGGDAVVTAREAT